MNKNKNKKIIKMKKLLFILMLSIVTFGYSQEFLGIKVQGKLSEVINKFKAKGFVLVQTQNNAVELVGKVQSSKVNLVIVSSLKSHIVWKFVVFLPERSNWYSLKDEYNDYVNLFTAKYGKPTDNFEFFQDPYTEGDGYELQGISMEKVTFSTYWVYDNLAYAVKIHKSERVQLTYENTINSNIHEREKQQQDYLTF